MSGTRKRLFQELFDEIGDFALHARTLGFVHPVTRENLAFAADPPPNFTHVIGVLRSEALKTLDNQ